MDCHFTRCLMQIRSDTCECHLNNSRPFTISGMYAVCDPTTSRPEEKSPTSQVPTALSPGAGEPRQMDVIFGANPYFSRPTHNCPFFRGKCMRRSQTSPPAHQRPSPLIKSPDSVKKDCMGRKGALRRPPLFNQLIYGVSDDDRD